MPTLWQSLLLPASFRGAPFGVLDTSFRGGRRVANHEYFGRDLPFVEDLGRRGRQYSFGGFVIGDDAGSQRDVIVTACEQKGPGSLIHPTLGVLQVACQEFETEERWDKGRVIVIRFTFLEAGQILFPGTADDTQAATVSSAQTGQAAASTDYATAASNAVATGVTT